MAIEEMPDHEDFEEETSALEDEDFDDIESELEDDDESDDEADDVSASGQEDKEEYGKKVTKRINTLVWERNKAREEAEAERLRTTELEKRLQALERNQIDKQRNDELEQKKAARQEINQKLKAAFEDGEADDIADLTSQLTRADAEIIDLEKKPQQEEEDFDDFEEEYEEDLPPMADASKSWMKENPWYTDPANSDLGILAENIERSLRNEGYELDNELYEELDRRLLAAAPRIADLKGEKKPSTSSKKKPRPVVSGQRSGDAVIPSNDKKGNKLTEQDLKSMRKYGFDPNSPDDRKAWLNRNAAL